MRRGLKLIWFIGLFCIIMQLSATSSADELNGNFFWARAVEVSDEDTITVVRRNDNLDMVVVRLFGIDAPENGQAHGKKVARELTRRVNKKIVLVEMKQKRDRYGRVVGVAKHEGKDVGQEMLAAGYAWVDPRFSKQDRLGRKYWATVRQAEKGRIGLWQD